MIAAASKSDDRWSGRVALSRRVGSDGAYALDSDLGFRGTRFRVRVLPGFATDGVSIPRALRWWADPYSGRHVAAAVIHDGLYATQFTTRAEADQLFLEALRACGVRRSQARLMWLAVRIFGGRAWGSKTLQTKKAARECVLVNRRTI